MHDPYHAAMELLRLEEPLPELSDPVLVVALDGWTDAGEGGSSAANALRRAFPSTRVGSFDGDALYDYRDRRPDLTIDRGVLGDLVWPELTVELVTPLAGPPLLLVSGVEPDFRWKQIASDLIDLAASAGADRYVGLGSVPGPIPHTRPVHLICTGNDVALLERMGRPHEQVVVPASCQVALEKLLGEAGLATLGLWVRVPHYVAGEYPQAARALLERLSSYLGTPVDLTVFDAAVDENRARLDVAASSSDEVIEHVRQLERLYDAEQEAERLAGSLRRSDVALSEEQVPSGEEIAAEIERFLKGRAD